MLKQNMMCKIRLPEPSMNQHKGFEFINIGASNLYNK